MFVLRHHLGGAKRLIVGTPFTSIRAFIRRPGSEPARTPRPSHTPAGFKFISSIPNRVQNAEESACF